METRTGYIEQADGGLYCEEAGALDYPTTLYAADIMAEGISSARKHIFAHSAHLPNMEDPDEFTRVVLEFLAGLK